jgi:hypothetical protein
MSELNVAYVNALLADASYFYFEDGPFLSNGNNGFILEAAFLGFEQGGWTRQQFDWLKDNYSVRFYQPNTASGFSGITFENIATGELTVVYRGTEGDGAFFSEFSPDLATDIILATGMSRVTEYISAISPFLPDSQTALADTFLVNSGILDAERNLWVSQSSRSSSQSSNFTMKPRSDALYNPGYLTGSADKNLGPKADPNFISKAFGK